MLLRKATSTNPAVTNIEFDEAFFAPLRALSAWWDRRSPDMKRFFSAFFSGLRFSGGPAALGRFLVTLGIVVTVEEALEFASMLLLAVGTALVEDFFEIVARCLAQIA
jgi:hypothetical protein